jgi:PadR family transcriptional regulator PadR
MPRSLRTDNLQGTLDLLVLKTLAARAPLHGYAIATHIQQVSDDFLRVEEGSLYPALHRIEGLGWIASAWSVSSTNRRVKLYQLTPQGRRQLEAEEQRWNDLMNAVQKVLQCCGA